MGDRHHLYSYSRTLIVPLYRAGLVFGARRGLVDESTSGPLVGRPSGADGLVAATWPHPGDSALGSGLSIHLGGIPTVLGGSPRNRQHECGGELRR
jgi:hypothetical protein